MKKMVRMFFLLILLGFLSSCDPNDTADFQNKIKENGFSEDLFLEYADSGTKMDSIQVSKRSLMKYFIENSRYDLMLVAFEKGCIASPGNKRFQELYSFIFFAQPKEIKAIFSAVTGSEDSKVQDAFFQKNFPELTQSTDYIVYLYTISDLNAKLKILENNSDKYFELKKAAFDEINLPAIKQILDLGYSLDKDDIKRAFKTKNLELIQFCYSKNSKVNLKDQEIYNLLPYLDKHSFAILLTMSGVNTSQAKTLISKCIEAQKYELAAYLINYSSQNYIDEKSAIDVVARYFDDKPYFGDQRKYTRDDVDVGVAVPENVSNALVSLGISHYVVLKNEMLARTGYIFKTPILGKIFNEVKWYEPKGNPPPLADIGGVNIAYIIGLEDEYRFSLISNWLSSQYFGGGMSVFDAENDFLVPATVRNALHYFRVNPSKMLRTAIYASNGNEYTDYFFGKVFQNVRWYKPTASPVPLSSTQRANLTLLQFREWIEIIDGFKNTTPNDVQTIPVLGYNTLFLKKLNNHDDEYYFSTHDINYINSIDNSIFEKASSINDGITDDVVEKIKSKTDSPIEALTIYFENKKYKGESDSKIITKAQFEPPDYLKSAVFATGLNWPLLLKKEIHARHGAYFNDPIAGPVFRNCSWYRSQYNLTISTLSRLPATEKLSDAELINFCLLEGEDIGSKKDNSHGAVICVDLYGNTYFIKIEWVSQNSRSFYSAYGFTDYDDYKQTSVGDKIENILKSDAAALEEYRKEEYYYYGGC